MSKENQETLEVYEKYADEYLKGSQLRLQHEPERLAKKRQKMLDWIAKGIAGLPKDATYFEFGSGDGEDVELFRELGVEITPSDAPESFLAVLRKKGLQPVKFNVITDEFPDSYDCIYSRRVLVHFTYEDAETTFRKVFASLKPGGRYIFNALNSAGHNNLSEEWVDFSGDYAMGVSRYFKYWREDELMVLLKSVGFHIRDVFPDGGEGNKRWFYVTAEKLEENKNEDIA